MKKEAIIVTAFLNYDYEIRIKYLRKYLEYRDYSCKIVSSDYDHRNKQIYTTDVTGVKLLNVPRYKRNMSVARIYSHFVFANKCKNYILNEKPDLVYAIVPPNFLVSRIISIKKYTKLKVIFEVEDLWPESLPIPNNIKALGKFFLDFWKIPRDKSLFKADFVVFECDLFKKLLTNSDNAGCGSKTIYLTKDDQFKISQYEYRDETLSYLYIGSVNNLIDIDIIIRILLESQKYKKTQLHIIGKGEKLDNLVSLCKSNNIKVESLGTIYDDKEKEHVFLNSHFGLNIMKNTVVVGATMKSLEYFYYGLPILNNIKGDTCNILDKNECGINIKNDDIVAAVKIAVDTLDNKVDYLKMRGNSRVVYDKLFSPHAFYNSFEEVYKRANL